MSEIKIENEKQERKRNILLVVIALLLLLNGYFAFNSYTTKKKNNYLENKRNELDSLYAGSMAILDKAQIVIDSLKGKNAILDSLIATKENELNEKRLEIEQLLQKNELNVVELTNAKKLIKNFQKESNAFIKSIDSYSLKIAVLNKEKDSLANTLQQQLGVNEKLLEENKTLDRKVVLGSLLKPENITGIGIKLRNNNSELETNMAKKAQKLKICFDVPENRIAEAEEKDIYVKIINPLGSTIFIENQGSGVFNNVETSEPTNYTAIASFNYEKKKKNVCLYWSQNTSFTKGIYKVKFFQNNYFLSEGNFELK